ncbi:hypothetical protein P9112_012702 [Eukaryota sp. TZLM1-RC]
MSFSSLPELQHFVEDISFRSSALIAEYVDYLSKYTKQQKIQKSQSARTQRAKQSKSKSSSYLSSYMSRSQNPTSISCSTQPIQSPTPKTTPTIPASQTYPRRKQFRPIPKDVTDVSLLTTSELDSLIHANKEEVFRLTQCISPILKTELRTSQRMLRQSIGEEVGQVKVLRSDVPRRQRMV